MIDVNIIETNLRFGGLNRRFKTDLIVIHHTGSVRDTDCSAAQIHDVHLNNGWAGIGYHFVIRKDGTIERGRPEWAIGAHAGENGMNAHSIGIHLSGDFNAAQPTSQQIESTAMLIAYLCDKYNIPTDRQHIKGHFEVGSTGCPCENLIDKLDIISGKANWYRYPQKPSPDVVVKDLIIIKSANAIAADTKAKIKAILDYADVKFEVG